MIQMDRNLVNLATSKTEGGRGGRGRLSASPCLSPTQHVPYCHAALREDREWRKCLLPEICTSHLDRHQAQEAKVPTIFQCPRMKHGDGLGLKNHEDQVLREQTSPSAHKMLCYSQLEGTRYPSLQDREKPQGVSAGGVRAGHQRDLGSFPQLLPHLRL